MWTQVVPLGSAPTLLPACVIRGLAWYNSSTLTAISDPRGIGLRRIVRFRCPLRSATLLRKGLCFILRSPVSTAAIIPFIVIFLREKLTKKLLLEHWLYAWDDVFRSKELGGSWSADGCKVVSSASNGTVCECNHLTSFASISVYDKVHPALFNSLHMLLTFYPAKHAFSIIVWVVEFARVLCDYNVKELRSRNESKDTEKREKWTAASLLSPT